jgi:type II secretory pathway component PulK
MTMRRKSLVMVMGEVAVMTTLTMSLIWKQGSLTWRKRSAALNVRPA